MMVAQTVFSKRPEFMNVSQLSACGLNLMPGPWKISTLHLVPELPGSLDMKVTFGQSDRYNMCTPREVELGVMICQGEEYGRDSSSLRALKSFVSSFYFSHLKIVKCRWSSSFWLWWWFLVNMWKFIVFCSWRFSSLSSISMKVRWSGKNFEAIVSGDCLIPNFLSHSFS